MMRPRQVGAIINPHAGGGDTAKLYAALQRCLPTASFESWITASPADVPAALRAQAEWADLVVAIGGDGTVRTVVESLVDTGIKVPLLIIPAGRGNSTYRYLYGDADWRELARGLRRGIDARPLEVGRVEWTPPIDMETFVLGFSAGLFHDALVNAERFRILPGRLAYLLAALQATALDPPVDVSVTVDGEPFVDGPTRLLAVGGGRYRSRDFDVFPDSRPGDGILHVLAVEPAGIRESVSLLRLAREGRLGSHPAVEMAVGETVTIRTPTAMRVELDGTAVETPVEMARISVVPDAITVAHPPGW